ncbi:hypothetical protein O181_030695, partial [Austropuccinia psidii MF-1]|nr:hypothetical protein [Austropuccinia psidii MF-1]
MGNLTESSSNPPWHLRLGNPRNQVLKSLGLQPIDDNSCDTCTRGKMTALPFKGHFVEVTKPLDCLHLDIVGPISPPSKSGHRYFLTIVNQYTSFKIIGFLKNKSEVFDEFVSQKTLIENAQDRKIKRILTDGGGEFVNNQFKSLATQSGFIHSVSPLYTPEHNGFAERANQTILDKARCLLLTSNLPNCYWAEAVNTATYIANSIPTPSRNNQSPHLLWTGVAPKNRMIRTFGWKVIFHVPRNLRNWKLAPTGEIGILLGITNESAYHILKISNNKVYISRHVTFFENNFPTLNNCKESNNMIPNTSWNGFFEEEDKSYDCLEEVEEQASISEAHSEEESVFTNPGNERPGSPPRKRIKVIGPKHPTLINLDIREANILPYPRRPTTHLTHPDPGTFNEALKLEESDTWMSAITKELNNMKELDRDEKQQTHEYKARLCAQGFSQTHGIDFSKTFEPTGLRFEQLDIKSAFLNAPLEDEVYLSIPQVLDRDKKKVCLKLKKAIYGLRQAPLAWYRHLSTWLINWGFKVSKADSSVFYRDGNKPIWLFVHVDNIGVFGKHLTKFKTEIKEEFSTKILGLADLILGIKITHEENSITLSQQHYIDSLLDLYGMTNCKPVATALMPNTHLEAASDEDKVNFSALNVNYPSAIGSLSYLSTATRPNLSFAVSALSQFLELPEPPTAYSDADWGNCRVSRRSVTGYLVTIHDNLVIWKTRKQPTVSLSSAEAKYEFLTDLSWKLTWFRQFCKEIGIYTENKPIIVHEDNQSCIDTANGNCNTNSRHMKHVDIQLHF